MYIGTTIPIVYAHVVRQQWIESTKPSVIAAVNDLIGQSIWMPKWYIRVGEALPRLNGIGFRIKTNGNTARLRPLGGRRAVCCYILTNRLHFTDSVQPAAVPVIEKSAACWRVFCFVRYKLTVDYVAIIRNIPVGIPFKVCQSFGCVFHG